MKPNLTGMFDTDRGQFYDYTVSVQMYLFRSIFPAIYFVLTLWCVYLLFIEIKYEGCSTKRSIQILVCAILFALGTPTKLPTRLFRVPNCYFLVFLLVRGFKIAYEEQVSYYTPAPRSPPLFAIDIILFWTPFLLGTQMYTLASFGWASVVQALHSHRVIAFMRLPLIGFFYTLFPLVVILSILGVVFAFSTLIIFCVLIICAGLFEAFIFLFFGIKILRILTIIKQADVVSATSEKRVRVALSTPVFLVSSHDPPSSAFDLHLL